MKSFLCYLLLLAALQSCGWEEREQKLAVKEQELSRKQAELLEKEQQLLQRERELEKKAEIADSSAKQIDSVKLYNPAVVGTWSVKMTCTETSCEGSAIGDTKTEQWEISYGKDNELIVKAYTGKNLSRIYNGDYRTGGLQLTGENSISVNLSFTGKTKMEGRRTISQPGCKITYSLEADKS